MVILFTILGCNSQVKPNLPGPSLPNLPSSQGQQNDREPPAPKPYPSGGQTPIISLTPYPHGWVPDTEGWIPPLPPGLQKPVPLTQEDWNRVIKIASTDPEVLKQTTNNNIREKLFWWVAYAGGPGNYGDSDSAIIGGGDSAVQSGKANVPLGDYWWYPGIRFLSPTIGHMGQLVAVDLATGKIVFSEGWGYIVPSR